MRHAGTLHVLEVLGKLQQVLDLLGGEVQETQEMTTAQAYRHGNSFR